MNTIYIYKDYAMMLIKHKGEYYRVYFDVEDIDLVQKYKWSLNSTGYAYNAKHDILLHRLIMQDELKGREEMFVDHINHDVKINTKSNLRVVSKSENCRNRQSIGKSGVSNIKWRADRHSWYVEFKHYGSKSFKDFFSAFDYRNKKAKELYGEYAFIPEQIEVYTTTDLREVGKLESNGFHYIICQSNEICDTFVYVYSHELKELLGHEEE
jgi:hypothetical protein